MAPGKSRRLPTLPHVGKFREQKPPPGSQEKIPSTFDGGPATCLPPVAGEMEARALLQGLPERVDVERHLRNDPWQHRSRAMRCATCMWFVLKQGLTIKAANNNLLGRCRRRSPTMSGFPAVFEDDWCGDHKLDENRI